MRTEAAGSGCPITGLSRRYFLDPFGCAKNQVDAETMMARLDEAGWAACEDAEDADLIIVNSCGFIEEAKRESINAVLLWRKRCPEKKILLAGCLAERYGRELAESLPEADGVFGNACLDHAARAAASVCGGTRPGEEPRPEGAPGRRPLLGFPGQAYVKISEGCDNRCSFCAIPLIRGKLRCREIPDIVEECAALLTRGVKELCLVGQDLAAYVSTGGGLCKLLSAIGRLPGRFWVRLLYLHPDHFPSGLLEVMKDDERFLPYFDIPFQHASAPLLKAMNRQGNAGGHLRLLDKIRDAFPDAVIRSTFLAGFPGETGEDFRALLDFQDRARFDWLGVFAFSREEGTPAYSMKGRAEKKIVKERKALIEERQIPITEERMNRFVGRGLEVLVEEALEPGVADAEPLWLGRLFCHAPGVDGAAVIRREAAGGLMIPGELVPCGVTRRSGFDLEVTVCQRR